MDNEDDRIDRIAKALDDIQDLQEESEREYHEEADGWWNSLSKEEQLAAFYSVSKRMHHGFLQGLSYRGILYGLFGFGKNAYGIGMVSGFMEIYNQCDFRLRNEDGE